MLSEWLQRERDESGFIYLLCEKQVGWLVIDALYLETASRWRHRSGGKWLFFTNNHEYERSTTKTEVSLVSRLTIRPWQREERRRTKNHKHWISICEYNLRDSSARPSFMPAPGFFNWIKHYNEERRGVRGGLRACRVHGCHTRVGIQSVVRFR